jgi:glycosyltransferase involved in cell wall biosynthesis
MSKVSILIPCYNAERWIADAIRSAQDQTWKDIETIVVDDGSTDNSYAVAKQFENPGTRVLRQVNQGPGAARNRAFSEATGEFIQYLDADDILHPEKIAAQMAAAAESPPDTLFCSRWAHFVTSPTDAEPRRSPRTVWLEPLEWLSLDAKTGLMMPPHGWLTPRTVIDRAGPWDERLSLHDDSEFFCRVTLQCTRIRFVPESLVYYRRGNPQSVSRGLGAKAIKSFYLVCRSIDRHVTRAQQSDRARKIAASYLALFLYFSDGHSPRFEDAAARRLIALRRSRQTIGGPVLRLLCLIVGTRYALSIRQMLRRLIGASAKKKEIL